MEQKTNTVASIFFHGYWNGHFGDHRQFYEIHRSGNKSLAISLCAQLDFRACNCDFWAAGGLGFEA